MQDLPPADAVFALAVERQVIRWVGPAADHDAALPPMLSRCVDVLGSRDYEARELASAVLASYGGSLPAIRAAAWAQASLDPEVRNRGDVLMASILCHACGGTGNCPSCGGTHWITVGDGHPDQYCGECVWSTHRGGTVCRECYGSGRPR